MTVDERPAERHEELAARTFMPWKWSLAATLSSLLVISGCSWFDADHWIKCDVPVRLVIDSFAVQKLIAEGERIERARQTGQESPEQDRFIDAMGASPNIEISPGSYFRLLQNSEAVCTKARYSTAKYVKLEVTTGKAKSKIVWGCLGEGVYIAHTMP